MKLKIVYLVFLCFFLSGCGYYRTITGTVVDAETMKPIEGAVVMVEWTKQTGMGEFYNTKSYKVIEKVTDKNGKVEIDGMFALIGMVPFITINAPDIAVYNPGYVTWSSRAIFPSNKGREDLKWGDHTFKLERFKPGYSYVEHEKFFNGATNSAIGGYKHIIKIFEDSERYKRIEERNK